MGTSSAKHLALPPDYQFLLRVRPLTAEEKRTLRPISDRWARIAATSKSKGMPFVMSMNHAAFDQYRMIERDLREWGLLTGRIVEPVSNERARQVAEEMLKNIGLTQPALWSGSNQLPNQVEGLHKDDVSILVELKKQKPKLCSLYDLESIVSRRTLGWRVTRLIEQGLAHRPHGPRRGVTITSKGEALLNSLAAA